MPNLDHTSVDLESSQRLRRVIGQLHRRLRRTDASAGLTPARASALLQVDRHGPLRLAELAETEGLNPTMLSRMVGELVQEGLLARYCDERDRRAAWVRVTPAGAHLARAMRRERTRAVNAALGELSDADAECIARALPALERLVDQLAGDRR